LALETEAGGGTTPAFARERGAFGGVVKKRLSGGAFSSC